MASRASQQTDTVYARSYEVELPDGTTVRRTSKHVRWTPESYKATEIDIDITNNDTTVERKQPVAKSILKKTVSADPAANDVRKTRSGRTIKTPARYCD